MINSVELLLVKEGLDLLASALSKFAASTSHPVGAALAKNIESIIALAEGAL